MAWGIFQEVGGLETPVGLVAGGQTLVRGDRLAGFSGYAAGAGCEPQLQPPAVPPGDFDDAMAAAVAVDADHWDVYESRIRESLAAVAAGEWATAALAGFESNPRSWFRLWLQGRREHERTEADLMRRLSCPVPGRPWPIRCPEASKSRADRWVHH
jgi:hypothetical protein